MTSHTYEEGGKDVIKGGIITILGSESKILICVTSHRDFNLPLQSRKKPRMVQLLSYLKKSYLVGF